MTVAFYGLMFYLTSCYLPSGYGISIKNFKELNLTDLKQLLGPQVDDLLMPIIKGARQPEESDEASVDEVHPVPPVYRDEHKNIFFNVWALRGSENRLMSDNKGHLCVAIQSSPEITHSFNMELWRFMSNLLQVRRDEVEIVVSEKNDMARRVIIKGRAITVRECEQRLHANMKTFKLRILDEAGAEEAAKDDELVFHAEVKSKVPMGAPLFVSQEDFQPNWGPNYIKNPTLLDRILRDLMPNQEIIIRGRLLKRGSPNFIARPLLENYQGQKTLKVKRKVLEGMHNEETERAKKFSAGPRMTCPGRIPGLSVIDTLSEDGSRVVNRKVFAPLFQNQTHDFIDELDYTEVLYKHSL